ncbi:hypothetical protein L1987_28720 [Smallanthus sonchifolius]|uniref:Uncharacterized protein n=1 Tax=Smallanthus sonchifolius TaxID=185202 RepID=A0ACB9HYI8_9ASTR|nr:hypothetical protein L1987_28720 [Smallanthus sonchifolius]
MGGGRGPPRAPYILRPWLPVFDGILDLVRCGRAVNRWIPVQAMEYLFCDMDRVLRSGGLFWVDRFFSKGVDLDEIYRPLIEKLGYKKVKWAVGNSSGVKNREVYLTALLQKPVSRSRQIVEYLMQKAKLHNYVGAKWNNKMGKQVYYLSRKLASCLHNLIETPSKLHNAKALFDCLDISYKALMSMESGINCNGQSGIDHLTKRVASLSRRAAPTPVRSRHVKKPGFARAISNAHVKPSTYQMRVVVCAYRIVAHPNAVFSGQRENETALAKLAKKFIQEFEKKLEEEEERRGGGRYHKSVQRLYPTVARYGHAYPNTGKYRRSIMQLDSEHSSMVVNGDSDSSGPSEVDSVDSDVSMGSNTSSPNPT